MKLTKEQRDHVKSLEDSEGRITTDTIKADAKKKSSPLHSLFEWDVRKAAEKHWDDVAREIFRVTYLVTTETKQVKVPVYVRDPEAKGNEKGYRSVVALKSDPLQARRSLIYALEMAAGNIRRAMDLSVALGLETEIDDLLEKVTGLQRSLREEIAA